MGILLQELNNWCIHTKTEAYEHTLASNINEIFTFSGRSRFKGERRDEVQAPVYGWKESSINNHKYNKEIDIFIDILIY